MAKPNLWFLLLKLATQGATSRPVFTSTVDIARQLRCSQQTASRWLKSLESAGLVEREIEVHGEQITVTKKGYDELASIYGNLKRAIEPTESDSLLVEGRVFKGLGEGAYYISKPGYKKQFKKKLGFVPFPGTLNLKLTKPNHMMLRQQLESHQGIEIEGFSDGERTYGGAKCFEAIINDKVTGIALIIHRTHHDASVLELIAPISLRSKLKISENDLVRVQIKLGPVTYSEKFQKSR